MVRYTLRTEASLSGPATWRSAASTIGASAVQRGEPHLCVAAGKMCDAAGRPMAESADSDIIAVLESSRVPRRGELVQFDAQPFRKPRGVSWDGAARLPFLLLTACAALQQAGVPEAGGLASGKTVMVAGSSGPLPPLLASLIDHRGAVPLVVGSGPSLDRITSLRKTAHHPQSPLGESLPASARPKPVAYVSTLDFTDPSLADSLGSLTAAQPTTGAQYIRDLELADPDGARAAGTEARSIHAVVDVVGCENEPWLLEERWGASYVSIATDPLKRLISDGAFGEISRHLPSFPPAWPRIQIATSPFGSGRGVMEPAADSEGSERAWLPDEASAAVLRRSLQLMESGALHMPDEIAPHKGAGAWMGGGLGGMLGAVAGPGSRAGDAAGVSAGVRAVWELIEQYKEYLSWPRDVDTGARAGFPGRDLWASTQARQMSDRGEGYMQLTRQMKR